MMTLDHYASSPLKTEMLSTRSIKTFFNYLKRVYNVAQERYELSQLDERMLKDIGITKAQAREEIERDFWDIPNK